MCGDGGSVDLSASPPDPRYWTVQACWWFEPWTANASRTACIAASGSPLAVQATPRMPFVPVGPFIRSIVLIDSFDLLHHFFQWERAPLEPTDMASRCGRDF